MVPFCNRSLDKLRNKKDDLQKTKVRILVDPQIARYIRGGRNQYGFVSEQIKKDGVEMTFMTPHLKDGFSRWYLMFGDYAKILEPESLRERVKELLRTAENNLLG